LDRLPTSKGQYSKLSANQTKGEGSKGCGTQKATHLTGGFHGWKKMASLA